MATLEVLLLSFFIIFLVLVLTKMDRNYRNKRRGVKHHATGFNTNKEENVK